MNQPSGKQRKKRPDVLLEVEAYIVLNHLVPTPTERKKIYAKIYERLHGAEQDYAYYRKPNGRRKYVKDYNNKPEVIAKKLIAHRDWYDRVGSFGSRPYMWANPLAYVKALKQTL